MADKPNKKDSYKYHRDKPPDSKPDMYAKSTYLKPSRLNAIPQKAQDVNLTLTKQNKKNTETKLPQTRKQQIAVLEQPQKLCKDLLDKFSNNTNSEIDKRPNQSKRKAEQRTKSSPPLN